MLTSVLCPLSSVLLGTWGEAVYVLSSVLLGTWGEAVYVLSSVLSVMITELRDEDVFSNHFINDSMFRIDPPRPKSLKGVLKRLRLADALMWAAHDFFNKRIDPCHHPRIILLPIQIIFPSLRRKDEIHASS